jgi:hypothetical protein
LNQRVHAAGEASLAVEEPLLLPTMTRASMVLGDPLSAKYAIGLNILQSRGYRLG